MQAEIKPGITQGLFSVISILFPGLPTGKKKERKEKRT